LLRFYNKVVYCYIAVDIHHVLAAVREEIFGISERSLKLDTIS